MGKVIIVQDFLAPGRGPVGLAWDGRYLWNADYSTARIFCLEPETLEVVRSLTCPGSLSGLAWDGRSLWQVMHMDGCVRRMNPATNDIDQTIAVADHGWLSGAAWDGRQLWAVSQQRGLLFALDPHKGDVVRTLPAPVAGGGLTFHDGGLWLAYPYPMAFNESGGYFDWQGDEQHYALVRLDAADGRETARYELDFLPMGLAFEGEELWLSHAGASRLYRGRLG